MNWRASWNGIPPVVSTQSVYRAGRMLYRTCADSVQTQGPGQPGLARPEPTVPGREWQIAFHFIASFHCISFQRFRFTGCDGEME
jgi:hypothetical protein